jgi:hypothetical protein
MKPIRLCAALLLLGAALAQAAPPAYLTLDHSSDLLMDPATAAALWKQSLSAKLHRLYPDKRWGFVSEVAGGFDDARVCVVTARALMLPRSGKSLIFRPSKTATTFGSQAGATTAQCKALAKAKLKEAIDDMSSNLLGS